MKPDDCGKIIPLVSWQRVQEAYERMVQLGWQSVEQAIRVGDMLLELKRTTPHGAYRPSLADIGLEANGPREIVLRPVPKQDAVSRRGTGHKGTYDGSKSSRGAKLRHAVAHLGGVG